MYVPGGTSNTILNNTLAIEIEIEIVYNNTNKNRLLSLAPPRSTPIIFGLLSWSIP
jgi:hypothetical protein